ncbi:MAG: hypothetical protein COT74_05310 [Bdellovibrionales bacterium CG10_big_fil_rev_8_21_14_0_10_45_34]|nr:MAG: hypothetical protein COT74_05310 [Bdellovibrionales bacterium CG10_big_fil_rev_8_21_14_0_10_45_34]
MILLGFAFHINDCGVDGISAVNAQVEGFFNSLPLTYKESIREHYLLKTCNRVEWYAHLDETGRVTSDDIHSFVEQFFGDQCRRYFGESQCVRHLLDVALSMDSLVFGENQIMGQIKRSCQQHFENGSVGPYLEHLISLVLNRARWVRSQVRMTSSPTSVAGVAAKWLAQTLESKNAPIIFVGASDTNETLAICLKKRGFTNLFWVNRSEQRALKVALQLGGEALHWDDFLQGNLAVKGAALAFATSAAQILLSETLAEKLSPSAVVDLSVPLNTEPERLQARQIPYLNMQLVSELTKETDSVRQIQRARLSVEIESSMRWILSKLRVREKSEIFSSHVSSSKEVYEEWLSDMRVNLCSGDGTQIPWTQFEKQTRLLVNRVIHNHIEKLHQLVDNPANESSRGSEVRNSR